MYKQQNIVTNNIKSFHFGQCYKRSNMIKCKNIFKITFHSHLDIVLVMFLKNVKECRSVVEKLQ